MASWSLKISDNFNRANEDPIASPWSGATPGWGTLKISSNTLRTSAGSVNSFAYHTTALADDQAVEIFHPINTYYAGSTCRVAAISGDADCYILSAARDAGPVVRLYKKVSGSYTQLGSTATGMNTNGIDRIEAEGTTIRCLLDGSEKISLMDSTFSSGYGGVYSYETAAAAQLDDFAAYDGVAGGQVVLLQGRLVGKGALLGRRLVR